LPFFISPDLNRSGKTVTTIDPSLLAIDHKPEPIPAIFDHLFQEMEVGVGLKFAIADAKGCLEYKGSMKILDHNRWPK
jgi:hypothetical protein